MFPNFTNEFWRPCTMDKPEEEYPHWNRVYIAVIVTTVIVITAMWFFSKSFA